MSYLIHHGILGQKWGVRRFQNEDGSYTELGKKRRGVKTNMSPDAQRFAELKKKKAYEMSNAELQEYNKRANLENTYYRSLNPSTIAKGLAIVAGATAGIIVLNNAYSGTKDLIRNGGELISLGKAGLNAFTTLTTLH